MLTDIRGGTQQNIAAIIGGVLTIVVGLVLSSTVLAQAASSGGSASIGSFGQQEISLVRIYSTANAALF